jgi:DNA-binding transcriptional ArsR family regulator
MPSRKAPPPSVDRLLAALAEPVRLEIVQQLLAGPRNPGELARQLGLSAPALSRHLRLLRRDGLIFDRISTRDARVRELELEPRALDPLRAWLDAVETEWQAQLRSFGRSARRTRARSRQ